MIEYTLERKKGRKSFGIYILSDGKVVVRVPYYTTKKRINEFVESKSQWINDVLKDKKEDLLLLPSLKENSKITIALKTYVVKYWDKNCAEQRGRILYLPKENTKKHLATFVKKIFLPFMCEKTEKLAKKFRFKYNEVSVGIATKKWGSCTFDNKIRYSLSLAFLPEKIIDYVVVHELCHTIEKNHKEGFYNILKSCMPDYKDRIKVQKSYSVFCRFLSQ